MLLWRRGNAPIASALQRCTGERKPRSDWSTHRDSFTSLAIVALTALYAASMCRASTSTHAAEVTAADFRALALGNPATPSLLQELDKMPFASFEAHVERVSVV